MRTFWHILSVAVLCVATVNVGLCQDQSAVTLPSGVKAVWDLSKAYHETTPTRERICINGLWLWQPVRGKERPAADRQLGLFQGPGALAENHLEAGPGIPVPLSASELEECKPLRGRYGLVPAGSGYS